MARYGASVFGGPADPGTGSTGYRGDNLNKKWKSFAELSNNPSAQDFSALGKLKYGTRVRVTNPKTGKSIVLTKRDVGAGGGAVSGHKRGIDLWYKAAEYLGINGTGVVDLEVLSGKYAGRKATTGVGGPQQPFDTAGRAGAIRQLLLQSVQNPSAGTALTGSNIASALISAATETASVPKEAPQTQSRYGGLVAKAQYRADRIASRNMSYKWGGGHVGSKEALRRYTGPLDCSGAVSKVLGIDPRVSGELTTIGKPGFNKNHVSIAANATHTFMWIPGRGWFGTSASNKGGGANYIKGKVSLKGFTVRHL